MNKVAERRYEHDMAQMQQRLAAAEAERDAAYELARVTRLPESMAMAEWQKIIAERDALRTEVVSLREEVARLLAEQSAEVPDLWASNDALRAERDALAAHNAQLAAALGEMIQLVEEQSGRVAPERSRYDDLSCLRGVHEPTCPVAVALAALATTAAQAGEQWTALDALHTAVAQHADIYTHADVLAALAALAALDAARKGEQ